VTSVKNLVSCAKVVEGAVSAPFDGDDTLVVVVVVVVVADFVWCKLSQDRTTTIATRGTDEKATRRQRGRREDMRET